MADGRVTIVMPNKIIDDLERIGRFTRKGDAVVISAFGERPQAFRVVEETADSLHLVALPSVTS